MKWETAVNLASLIKSLWRAKPSSLTGTIWRQQQSLLIRTRHDGQDKSQFRLLAVMTKRKSNSRPQDGRTQVRSYRRPKPSSDSVRGNLRITTSWLTFCSRVGGWVNSGNEADIFEVEHKLTHDWRVAKKINTSSAKSKKLVENEIAILQELDHPNILKIHEYFQDGDHTILITE